MSDLPEFVLDREFDAPLELVWRAWTNPEFLQRWYGPGVETVIHKFDLKPDGVWLNEMKMSGGSNYQKIIFKEVAQLEKLVWHHCSADADWNIAASPMMPDWPRILLTTVTFADNGDRTNVRLAQIPVDATDAEIACFAKMKDGMSGGWGSGYAIIDELLAELKAG
ncbi:MAG: SRPBCC domain-containing protein [Gammaproteobacteria bacterium]|nr:SRPBCC domain-containing protein [Gammaproteobacteria bacterium]